MSSLFFEESEPYVRLL